MIKTIRPSLAEAGKIKIGRKGEARRSSRGKEFRPPVKLDHFLVTTTKRDQAGDFVVDEELMATLRDQGHADPDGAIRSIPIVLHSDDIEEVFPTTYAMYVGRKLACRGDGETAVRFRIQNGKRTGESKEIECTCPYLGADGQPACKPHGILNCSIMAPGRRVAGSIYKWRTTSMISIERMVASLEQIRGVVGSLAGLPLLLRVEPVSTDNGDVYVCHVELREEVMEAQQRLIELGRRRREVAMMASPARLAIAAPASDDESDEEQADVTEEFFPDAVDVEWSEDGDVASGDPKPEAKPQPQPKSRQLRRSRLADEDEEEE